MARAPFEEYHELCSELEIDDAGGIRRRRPEWSAATRGRIAPTLPGNPRISLTDPEIHKTLGDELITEKLNRLAPHFWLFTTQSSKNILSLTEQAVQGREITITENPGLHLVWMHQRIFIKPLPRYLLSHAFWKHYLLSATSPIPIDKRAKLLQAARGFVRSYAYLIRHESDFRIATIEKHLIPEGIPYAKFAAFIASCTEVDDADVSPRYQAGELRLKRLNFWTKVFFFEGCYYRVKWQYAEYFARFYGPLLFTFALFALLLNAMQIVLDARTALSLDVSWLAFVRAAHGFALFIIFLVAGVIAFLLLTLVGLVAAEISYALRDLYRKSRENRLPRDQEHQAFTTDK
ncbi:hypothetical protein F4861DRAFT_43022 [Xylaria intraflava]|nr:hypothetical protein F4861DRAFT_43022 [Xylaria intraflava]